MRVIFAGRDNIFNRKIVQEFAREHEVLCCLFLEPERVSRKGKREAIMQRIKKQGLIKVMDQLAFHLLDRSFLRKNESAFWREQPEYYFQTVELSCPTYQVSNINHKQWVDFCREQNPDIILATCSKVIFKPQLFNIPALGTYIVHEGLTPEYKGLHTPLWALMKKEFQHIGYTVLKANEKVDGGEILAQKAYTLRPGEDYRAWSWIGHNAIISGLGDILHSFKELEKNRGFHPIPSGGRKNGYYTWMGLSDFIWLYLKNYWLKFTWKQSYESEHHRGEIMEGTTENVVLH